MTHFQDSTTKLVEDIVSLFNEKMKFYGTKNFLDLVGKKE